MTLLAGIVADASPGQPIRWKCDRHSDYQRGWRELLGGRYLRTSVVLAGGVALYATNEFLTTSLLPNTVAEIGGSRLYAWVTTLYLVGSVASATMVNPMLLRVGPRSSYLTGLAVFGVASLVCAAAPSIEILIAGRALQGVAGGLLAGLGYAVINAALPRSLWTRGTALVSAMWGVATVVGPATGGFFAQFGLWRWAFVAMAVCRPDGHIGPRCAGPGRVEASADLPAMKVPVGRWCLSAWPRWRSASRRFRTTSPRPRGCSPPEWCWSACS